MTKGPGVPKKKQQPRTGKAAASFDVCDGGGSALDLPAAAVSVRVTDRTTGAVADPAGYVVDGSQVRKVAGVWARGRGRWLIEHERGGDGGES